MKSNALPPAGPSKPLISVVLPVHDGERYLAESIGSILRQTYSNFELIVIDDGSTDGSARIAAGFDDERVVLVRNDTNLGLVATLNKGLALARGDLIARMDADDVADPGRLETQVAYFARDPGIVALGTGIRCIDADGRLRREPRRQVQGPVRLRWRLLRGTCLYHPTLMLCRSRAGGEAHYAPEFVHAEDYELLLRLSRRHDLDNLPDRLLAHRVHAGSVSFRFREVQRDSAARALVLHARERYGVEVAPGQARALLDPRHLFSRVSRDEDVPVGLILKLERRFYGVEPGITRGDARAVQTDVAAFLWKLLVIATTDWRAGGLLLRRATAMVACLRALALRPIAALAALAGL
jgi:hypothetical protein